MRKILTYRPGRQRALTVLVAAMLTFLAVVAPLPSAAQTPFAPAITVNQSVITYYELEQRALFLTLLQSPGDPFEAAREDLVEERLKEQLIAEAGIEIAPEDIEAGIEELASRTDLTAEQFVKALNDGGVSRETLRDFVEIGIAWREYVTARFLARSRPTEEDIDRALGRDNSGGGVSVKLAEIIIPVTPQTVEQAAGLALEIAQIEGYDAFSAAARQYSAADSRTRGGEMDWIPINNLPPALRPVILSLSQGEVTEPLTLPNAVALFQMRGIREIPGGTPRYNKIEYATYFVPGGRSAQGLAAAKAVTDRVDTCDDLYGVAKDQPPEVLERHSKAPGEIPRDIALELARLDEGEVSTALTTADGQTLIVLMLCSRTAARSDDASREEIATALTQQRVNALAESLLAQTRADSVIIER